MISDADRYYGAALCSVVNQSNGIIEIQRTVEDVAGFYILNRKTPLYIKYSTSRIGPWQFTFHSEQQMQQQMLFELYGECLVAFVCGKDGIAAVSHEGFRTILDDKFEEQESVTIRRRRREMYRIKGRDGVFERKVSRNSLYDLLQMKSNPESPIL